MNNTAVWLLLFTMTWFTGALLPSLLMAEEGTATGEWNVEQLIRGLAKHSEEVVGFEETTFSDMLTEPFKTKGTLKFTPPSRLEKHITAPYDERYVIDGDKVLFESKKKRVSKSFSLEDYPALQMFVEVFRSTFAGDPAALQRFYKMTLEGEPSRWFLVLHPQDPTLQSKVHSIRLSGEGDRMTRIESRSSDGDRSVLVIQGPRGE